MAARVIASNTHDHIIHASYIVERQPEISKNGSAAIAVYIQVRSLKYRYLQYICTIPKLEAGQRGAQVKTWPYIYLH